MNKPLKHPFQSPDSFLTERYQILPFDFERIDSNRVLLTNLTGEYTLLPNNLLEPLIAGVLPTSSPYYKTLEAKHFVYSGDGHSSKSLLALKHNTKTKPISAFTGLHIFVPTLRCDHSCQYCQVSRQSATAGQFDMTIEHAMKALDWVFLSPNPAIKIEFQGGESLLNFPLVQQVILQAERRNLIEKRNLQFVITSTLAFLTPEIIEFARERPVFFSTSLDGPETLHNANRPRPSRDSFQKAIEGIRLIRKELGSERVSALMTTTERSLPNAQAIIDSYLEQGFNGIFLRSLSPYGFALKSKQFQKLQTLEWLRFYQEGLSYIFELNRKGIPFTEYYTALIARKILTPFGTSFVDLQNPSGSAISAVVYNYDGKVYASDEGRMLAETGDNSFELGHLDTHSYAEVFHGQKLLNILHQSLQENSPICDQCAFRHYCGTDPAYHTATQQDLTGHKTFSGFCQKQKGIFHFILDHLTGSDPFIQNLLHSWAWNSNP